MDFQSMLSNAVDRVRQAELEAMPILSLGELIAKLESIPDNHVFPDGDSTPVTVRYDFEYLKPTTLDSWRGVYAELALGFSDEGGDVALSVLLAELRGAVGKTFHGYKGGEYVMSKRTPVWVANYSHAGNTAIVNVLNLGYEAILVTQFMEGT